MLKKEGNIVPKMSCVIQKFGKTRSSFGQSLNDEQTDRLETDQKLSNVQNDIRIIFQATQF